MPFTIHKSGDGWQVVKKSTGAVIPGESATKSRAVARIGAIESHLHEEGKDMDRTKYDEAVTSIKAARLAKPTHPHGKATAQTFDGSPAGPMTKVDLSGSKNAAPKLDPPPKEEENEDMNPWAAVMRRVGPGATMMQLRAAVMESPHARSWH